LVIALIIPFMWFFGVHGAIIIGGIMGPLLQANALDNARILKAGKALTVANGGHIVTQSLLDQFGTVTGSGMTIGLVIFMVVFAKSAQMKSLGALEVAPAIFNINEPILFGLPIVMNPLMFIPFAITPAISMGLTYWAIKLGIIPLFTGFMPPWTTPPIISGFLVGASWKTAAWQALMLVMTFFIYLPFARRMDKQMYAEEQANLAAEEAAKKNA
jgi:PTS system cellobiose-specific IIC component